jgi:hypothetical protein
MNEHLVEAVARQQIQERVSRASSPRVRNHHHRRQSLASRLRRVADRLDG